MKPKNKELANNMSRSLKFTTIDMITSNINEEDTGELLDIIVSAHITSMFNCMNLVAEMCDNETPKENVSQFITELQKFLRACGPVEEVEVCNI